MLKHRKVDLLLQDIKSLLEIRKRSMYKYCDPENRTEFSNIGYRTIKRISIIKDLKCKLQKLFLINLLASSTRTWMQFELSKNKILGSTNLPSIEQTEEMLEFIFANPPSVKIVGQSSGRLMAEIKFLLNTDILQKILKQEVSDVQVQNFFKYNIVCEYSFKSYPENLSILKGLSSYNGKYTFINERYTYVYEDKPKDKNEYPIRQISQILTHEYTIRYILRNQEMGLLSPLKFEIRIFESIESQEKKKDFVESGDFFDHYVNDKKTLSYDPYSLLLERKVKMTN